MVRQSNGATVLQAQAASWRWSPDDNRIVIALVSGTVPNQLQQYWLFDLDAASPATPIWQASSTLWGPTRLRFSEDGAASKRCRSLARARDRTAWTCVVSAQFRQA